MIPQIKLNELKAIPLDTATINPYSNANLGQRYIVNIEPTVAKNSFKPTAKP